MCGEGIEELADLRMLADLDATYAQGYALASAGRLAAWLLDADDVGVMRIRPDGETVDLVSQHDIDEVGETWQLSDFPATRHLIESGEVGQAVAGDPHGDAAELAELDRMGMGAMLIIPAPLGAAGRALVEIYRVRPQAFSRAEIERAQVVALQLGSVIARVAG